MTILKESRIERVQSFQLVMLKADSEIRQEDFMKDHAMLRFNNGEFIRHLDWQNPQVRDLVTYMITFKNNEHNTVADLKQLLAEKGAVKQTGKITQPVVQSLYEAICLLPERWK